MSRTGASSQCDYRSGRESLIVCRGGEGSLRGSSRKRKTCPGDGLPLVFSSKDNGEGEGVLPMDQWKEPTMRKWWPLVAICAGACMLLVDVTIVNVALPAMARHRHTGLRGQQVTDG